MVVVDESHLEHIHRVRGEQWTIIITAILFGLTLNLTSDFISSVYDVSVDSATLAVRGIVAGLASLVTIATMWWLAVRSLSPLCKVQRDIQVSYFFDTDTGYPHDVPGYPPTERVLSEFARSTEKQKEEFSQAIRKAGESTKSATSELPNLVPFLELLTMLRRNELRKPR